MKKLIELMKKKGLQLDTEFRRGKNIYNFTTKPEMSGSGIAIDLEEHTICKHWWNMDIGGSETINFEDIKTYAEILKILDIE